MNTLASLKALRTAAKLAKLIKAATPAAIEANRSAVAQNAAEVTALENNCENERAKFARALYFKRLAALQPDASLLDTAHGRVEPDTFSG